jgi:uncharacterized membrane protein YgcG
MHSVDKLSNGNRIVAITVYVPANFVVSGTESFRVVNVRVTVSVHTTYSCQKGYHDVIIDGIHECVPNAPEHTPEYLIGLKYGTMDGQVGIYDLAAACGKYRGTAFDHCSFGYRTAYVTNCLNSKFGCGDGPTNLPQPTSHASNFTATTPTSGSNFTIPASGGKGTGSTCVGNCTTGPSPPVDCKINPNDPSCTQTLQPLTPPTTKTCPDGSQPDSSGKCPTTQSPSSPPSSNNNNPPTKNPPPTGGSSNNNGGGDGSSSKSGGNSGNGGSSVAGKGGSAYGGNGGNGGSGGNGGNANGRNG